MRSDTRCPGCGALNAPDARVCDWCGRPFLLRDQRPPGRLWWTVGAVVSVLAVFVVVLLALTNASRLTAREGSAPPTRPPTAAPAGETAPPTPPETVAPAEPTPTPAEYVRVANTGRQGIILRRDPNTAAPRVVARAENTTLRVVGPDQVVDGRVWRQVEDSQGNRGWAPAEFLAPSPPPGG